MKATCNLVLSGGGMRGNAHVGIIKALYEKEIFPKAVSGTSSGALVGAFICDGFHPAEVEEIILKNEPQLGFNYSRFWESILSFNSFSEVLKKNLRSKKIEDLQLPLYVSATNLINGMQEIITQGNIVEVLTASAAIPVVLPPVFMNGVPYADGGVSNNLPVEPFLKESLPIVGCHVNPLTEYNKDAGVIHTIDRSMHLIMRAGVNRGKGNCAVFIEPPALRGFHLFESKKTKEMIAMGYRYVMDEMDLSPLNAQK